MRQPASGLPLPALAGRRAPTLIPKQHQANQLLVRPVKRYRERMSPLMQPAENYTDVFAGLRLFWKHYLRDRWLRFYGWAQFHSWGKYHARFTIEAYEHVMKRRSAQQE